MAGGLEGTSFEFTPTWVVAALCTVIVGISIAVERLLHYTGEVCFSFFFACGLESTNICSIMNHWLCVQKLKKADQKPLFEALQKIKEGFSCSSFIYHILDTDDPRIYIVWFN